MHKALLRSLETGALAEIGIVAFVVAFLLMVAWAFRLKPNERHHAKHQPLNDAEPVLSNASTNGHG
ncbi:MAG: cbb3-type cytochrome c oxidase subunit 3 [Bacteroidota bacterium]